MDGYDPAAYGDAWAEFYDQVHARLPDTSDAVDTLARLSGGGPVLELGVGTGRLALPLAARGVEVHGVDASQAMLDRLRGKPGGAGLTVTRADFATIDLDRSFAVVVLVFNTLFNLPTQAAQVRCFATAAAHLRAGGRFVVEAFVPDLSRFHGDQAARVSDVTAGAAALTLERHDPVSQTVDSVHLHVGEHGLARPLPVSVRYAWPSELDLMARLAGLTREERWGDWSGTPFTAASTAHVSVYRRDE